MTEGTYPRSASEAIASRVKAPAATAKGYIVSPVYDSIFIIFSPLIALALGVLIYFTDLRSISVTLFLFDHEASLPGLFIGTFIMAHLVIVFFRSHGNKKVFSQFPYRFTVVPLALFTGMCMSPFFAIAVGVLAIWWDVYHSSLQTFGFGRIYDARAGNDVNVGRRLDYYLNLLIYAGPILAGATLMLHTESFQDFKHVNSLYFASFGNLIDANQNFLTEGILAVGVPFLVYYLYSYWRFAQQGYKVSYQKVALLVSTAACSIYTWGFNTFGEAFFIMNFFHAFQYFAIVWWSEKKNMMSLFRLQSLKAGKPITLMLFLIIGFGYGFWAEATDSERLGTSVDFAFNIAVVVAIMHFWYDGFVWSVRKKQI